MIRFQRTLLCLLMGMLSLLQVSAASAETISGFVRTVYDGDTILLATRRNSRMKVRLYGIDAPETGRKGESGQPFSRVAKNTLMYKIMGRQVSAEIKDADQYKRAVAIIRYQGRDINREMVAEGMAWAYRQYLHTPYASEYIDAEQLARTSRRGLWRKPNPQPPWEFRKRHKHKRGWLW